MKTKIFLSVFAVIAALTIVVAGSAFTDKGPLNGVDNFANKSKISEDKAPASKSIRLADPLYYIYQSGDQDNPASYQTPTTEKPDENCPDATNLCWFKVNDVVAPFGVINLADFMATYHALDANSDGIIDSNDVTEDGENVELRN